MNYDKSISSFVVFVCVGGGGGGGGGVGGGGRRKVVGVRRGVGGIGRKNEKC